MAAGGGPVQAEADHRPRLNWSDAYARLERWRQGLAAEAELGPAEVLRQRAQALAQPEQAARQADQDQQFLLFSRAGAAYAVAAGQVQEVFPLPDLTAVPGTPPHIPGVVIHRGKVLTVVDLSGLVGTPDPETLSGGYVVAVATAGKAFGLLAETVVGMMPVAAADLAPHSGSLSGERQPYIRAVTPDMAGVVDVDALVRGRSGGADPLRQ